ncbi:hypothetical protein [Agaribacter marinus]|uniref:Peptidase MA superfamily protein n=1 Tax=Agaribacter marinus TaxID=1431249 RepID=A0AA37T5N9_9ALTE|nr:hypothetical protein [Agaribacter marinus]GLR72683.1 hypothetical protein GCM10007852_35910 [Agaribacter marinus]
MKFKKPIIWMTCIAFVCIVALAVTQPILIKAILAKYKSTDHFLVLQTDDRIRYEVSAEQNAIILSGILSDSQDAVMRALNANFNKPVAIYVCASQESFNEYVFLSKNVRGAVYWGKLFLSPGAFSRGSVKKLTIHELTHYLFYTHLGEKAHIQGVPLWFREGVAEFVANGGADYTIDKDVFGQMSDKERDAYLSGKLNFWFFTQNATDALSAGGTVNWLLYRVGGLFVHFMHDLNPKAFDRLITLLLSGVDFSEALQESYGQNTDSLLNEFTLYLSQKV